MDCNVSRDVHQSQVDFLKYYDHRPDLKEEDYWTPLHQLWPGYFKEDHSSSSSLKMQLKSKKNRSFKHLNQFFMAIGAIPYRLGGYDRFMERAENDGTLKVEQRR